MQILCTRLTFGEMRFLTLMPQIKRDRCSSLAGRVGGGKVVVVTELNSEVNKSVFWPMLSETWNLFQFLGQFNRFLCSSTRTFKSITPSSLPFSLGPSVSQSFFASRITLCFLFLFF